MYISKYFQDIQIYPHLQNLPSDIWKFFTSIEKTKIKKK